MSDSIFQKFTAKNFDKTLLELSRKVTSVNLIQIQFLCSDQIHRKGIETNELFTELKTLDLISASDVSYVAELLWRSWRKDLVKQFLVNDMKSYEAFANNKDNSNFTKYRRMLHDLCENLTETAFTLLKEATADFSQLSSVNVLKLQEPQDLFSLLEDHNLINRQNYALIPDLILQLNNSDLTKILSKYVDLSKSPQRIPADNVHVKDARAMGDVMIPRPAREPATHELGVDIPVNNRYAYMNQQSHASDRQHPTRSIEHSLLSRKVLGKYKMDARPRGICVIINNINFYVSEVIPGARLLKKREGGQEDLNLLKRTWEQLQFEVKIYQDATAQGMQMIMAEMGLQVDHGGYDAFACCILTHGANSTVYSSDGVPVKIKDLINPMKPLTCPTLANKPKMFFVQACQGSDKQEAIGSEFVNIETDQTSFVQETSALDETSVPNEADILVSFATVPGFVSYRSRSAGSFYIRQLCECLDSYSNRYDLISILTEVNNCVAQMGNESEMGNFKQVPQPNTTLRKAVCFY